MRVIAITAALLMASVSAISSAATIMPAVLEQSLALPAYQMTYLAKQNQPVSGDYFDLHDMHFTQQQNNATRTVIVPANKQQGAAEVSTELTPTSLVKGEQAPAIKGKNLLGHEVTENWSSKQFVLISAFFADCTGCANEIPAVKDFAERHPNVKILYITWDSIENSRKFTSLNDLEALIIADAKPWLQQVGVSTYPTLMLLSPTGRLLYADAGDDADGSALQKMAELLIPAV